MVHSLIVDAHAHVQPSSVKNEMTKEVISSFSQDGV